MGSPFFDLTPTEHPSTSTCFRPRVSIISMTAWVFHPSQCLGHSKEAEPPLEMAARARRQYVDTYSRLCARSSMMRCLVSGFALARLMRCHEVHGVHGIAPCTCVPRRVRTACSARRIVSGLPKSSSLVNRITSRPRFCPVIPNSESCAHHASTRGMGVAASARTTTAGTSVIFACPCSTS